MQSAIVLGGGMVGVSTALHLQRRGWSVTLVDRKEPGRETSYGNAGIIQSEAVRPYPMPRDPAVLARIAMGRTNDVHYRLASLPRHAGPLLRYWWNSTPERHREATLAWARLIAHATAEHDTLIRDAHADNLIRRAGYRLLHRDPAALEQAIAVAEENRREFGVQFRVLDGRELAKAEPLLRDDLPGAIQNLVIARLPYENPSTGTSSVVKEIFKARGHDDSMARSLMTFRRKGAASRKLRQGLGRPIRGPKDDATVWFADPRFPLPARTRDALVRALRQPVPQQADIGLLNAIPARFRNGPHRALLIDGAIWSPT